MSRTTHSRQSRNLAARMGGWSAAHCKTATLGWLAFVVVAFALGGAVGTKTINPNTSGPGAGSAGLQLPALNLNGDVVTTPGVRNGNWRRGGGTRSS